MESKQIRVGVNGYGVIGKRVAEAVALQDDMTLVGVADVGFDWRIKVVVERGYPVYASVSERRGEMETAGIPIAGILPDLLGEVEVIVDCTPKGIGAANKAAYERGGVKAIFQGGEPHDLAGYSFVAQVNYPGAVHSFTNPDAGAHNMEALAYDEQADRQSWQMLLWMLADSFD